MHGSSKQHIPSSDTSIPKKKNKTFFLSFLFSSGKESTTRIKIGKEVIFGWLAQLLVALPLHLNASQSWEPSFARKCRALVRCRWIGGLQISLRFAET